MPADSKFDPICYLNRYPDLKVGYMYKSADGSWKYGEATNRQLKKISDNLFWHWQNFGMAEGRVCGCDLPGTIYSNEFNAAAYLARYPDIRLRLQLQYSIPTDFRNDPEAHYRMYGIYEGRHPGFEILTSASPNGMVSPGTTTMQQDANLPQSPGDGTVISPDNPTDTNSLPLPDSSTQTSTSGFSEWVSSNPILAAGIAGAAIILISKNKKKRK